MGPNQTITLFPKPNSLKEALPCKRADFVERFFRFKKYFRKYTSFNLNEKIVPNIISIINISYKEFTQVDNEFIQNWFCTNLCDTLRIKECYNLEQIRSLVSKLEDFLETILEYDNDLSSMIDYLKQKVKEFYSGTAVLENMYRYRIGFKCFEEHIKTMIELYKVLINSWDSLEGGEDART